MLAWNMYATDNNDVLPPNDYPYLTRFYTATATGKDQMKCWVVGTMADSGRAYFGTKELLDAHSLLSRYLANVAVYHCPADNYIDPNSKSFIPGVIR